MRRQFCLSVCPFVRLILHVQCIRKQCPKWLNAPLNDLYQVRVLLPNVVIVVVFPPYEGSSRSASGPIQSTFKNVCTKVLRRLTMWPKYCNFRFLAVAIQSAISTAWPQPVIEHVSAAAQNSSACTVVVTFLCNSGARYKYHDLLTYLQILWLRRSPSTLIHNIVHGEIFLR